MDTITINGIEYAPVGNKKAETWEGLEYKIVRTYSAGVFAGYLESRNDREAVIRQARQIWKWAGAASLCQLAVDGTSKPDECKFPTPVDKIEVLEVIQILDVTDKAKKSIEGVPIWSV